MKKEYITIIPKVLYWMSLPQELWLYFGQRGFSFCPKTLEFKTWLVKPD